MNHVNDPMKKIMAHYAKELDDKAVLSILEKGAIESEDEAKDTLSFLDSMCDRIAEDTEAGIVVLNQPIHTTDAEKICDAIEDYIEELGYEIDG